MSTTTPTGPITGTDRTAKARSIFWASFEQAADPTNSLDPTERLRRADDLRRERMRAIALIRHRRQGAANEVFAETGLVAVPS